MCVVILCVGIGIGIVHHTEGNSSDDNSVEYEAYDEDYVDYLNDTNLNNTSTEKPTVKIGGFWGRSNGVVDVPTFDQVYS